MEGDSGAVQPLRLPGDPSSGVELRHLRYLVAVAEAGSFTHAAERMCIAQPTLSQQIRRLEQMVGALLLSRQRDGLHLTPAGVEVIWQEVPLDAGFAVVSRRQADAALGWLMSDTALPDPLNAVELGQFEPELWIPATGSAGDRRVMGLEELVHMDVVHGPRRASPVVYDAWLAVLQARHPGFAFTDPPSRHSLPVALAFAASADRPTAVLSGPVRAAGEAAMDDAAQGAGTYAMTRVRLAGQPLTATAAVAWSRDLPCRLQQVLSGTACAGNGSQAGGAAPVIPPAATLNREIVAFRGNAIS